MTTYGDQRLVRHRATEQFHALLAYHMADHAIIPFHIPRYSGQTRLDFTASIAAVAQANATATLDPSSLAAAIDELGTAGLPLQQSLPTRLHQVMICW